MLSGEAVHSWRVAVEIQLMFFNATIGSKNYITAADETHPSLLDNLLYFSPSLPSLAFDGTLSPSFVRFCDTYISSDNNNRPRTERVYNFVEICIAHAWNVRGSHSKAETWVSVIYIHISWLPVGSRSDAIDCVVESKQHDFQWVHFFFIHPTLWKHSRANEREQKMIVACTEN